MLSTVKQQIYAAQMNNFVTALYYIKILFYFEQNYVLKASANLNMLSQVEKP